jgi:hypothetical protein
LDRIAPLIGREIDIDSGLSNGAKYLKIDTSRPGFIKLRGHDIEWVTASVHFGRSGTGEKTLHRFMLACPAIRMVARFDWLAFLRQWKLECQEVRTGRNANYKVTGAIAEDLGDRPCAFLPDDRTIVLDEEAVIRKIASGEAPEQPAFVLSPAWERASRSLAAFAVKSQDGTFAKHYDLGRPDDAVVLSLFKGIDWWILSADDADDIALHAEASCRNRDASESVSRSLESLIKLGRKAIDQELQHLQPETPEEELGVRMVKPLLAMLRVEHTDNAITVRAQGFGTLADFAAIAEGIYHGRRPRAAARKDTKDAVKR